MAKLINLLKRLSEENQRLYRYLSIFKTTSWLSPEIVERLWKIYQPSLNFTDCETLIREFAVLGLIEVRDADKSLRLPEAFQAANQEYLRSNGIYQNLHQGFLDSYETRDAWWELAEDAYIFENLAYHLSEAGRDEALHELLTGSNLWMDAKWKRSFNYSAFRADIELAMQRYKDPLSAEDLLKYLELHIVQRITETGPSQYSYNILQTLAYLGRDKEAISAARSRPNPVMSWMGLFFIWQVFQETGDANPISTTELIELGKALTDVSARDSLFSRLANWLIQEGNFEAAKSVCPLITNDGDRSRVLWALGSKLAKAGRDDAKDAFQQSRDSIELVPDTTNYRSGLFKELSNRMREAGYLEDAVAIRQLMSDWDAINRAEGEDVLRLAEKGDFDAALKILATMKETDYKIDVSSNFALILAKAGDKRASEIFTQAQELINPYDEERQVKHLATLALRMREAGDERSNEIFQQARTIAENWINPHREGEILEHLGICLAEASEFSAAMEVVEKIEDFKVYKQMVWSKIAAKKIEQGASEEALALLQNIPNAFHRNHAWLEVAKQLLRTKDKRLRLVYEQIEKFAMTVASPQQRAYSLYSISEGYLEIGEIEEAWRVAQNIPPYRSDTDSISRVALQFAKTGDSRAADALQKSLDAAKYTSDLPNHAEMVRMLAISFAKRDDKRANKLFAYAQELGLEFDHNQQSFFRSLSRDFVSLGNYEQAWRSLENIYNIGHKASALRELGETLVQKENNLANRVLKDAKLAFDNMIGTNEELCFALANSLIQSGEIEAASELIPKLTASHFQIAANLNLAMALAKAKDSRAKQLFMQVWELIKADMSRRIDRNREFLQLQQGLVQAGEVGLALEVVEASPKDRLGRALSEFVSLLTDEGQYRMALQIAKRFRDTEVVAKLAAHLSDSPMFKEVWEYIQSFPERDYKAKTLQNLALALLAKGDKRAHIVAAYTHELWRSIEDGSKAYLMRELAVNLAKAGYFQSALQILPQVDNPYHNALALLELGQELSQKGHSFAENLFKQAQALMESNDEPQRSQLLDKLATAYVEMNRLDDARQIMELLSLREQGHVFSRLIKYHAQRNEMDEMGQIVDRLLNLDDSSNVIKLEILARNMGDEKAFQQARAIIDKLPEPDKRLQALKELSIKMAQAGDRGVHEVIEEILKMVQSLPDTEQQGSFMANFSSGMAEAGIYKQSLEDLRIRRIQDLILVLIGWQEGLAIHYSDEKLWPRLIESAIRIGSWQHQEFVPLVALLAQSS